MSSIWSVLEIEPTNDIRVIRQAYAKLSARYHPEEFPKKYKEVSDAYQVAMNLARKKLVEESKLGLDSANQQEWLVNQIRFSAEKEEQKVTTLQESTEKGVSIFNDMQPYQESDPAFQPDLDFSRTFLSESSSSSVSVYPDGLDEYEPDLESRFSQLEVPEDPTQTKEQVKEVMSELEFSDLDFSQFNSRGNEAELDFDFRSLMETEIDALAWSNFFDKYKDNQESLLALLEREDVFLFNTSSSIDLMLAQLDYSGWKQTTYYQRLNYWKKFVVYLESQTEMSSQSQFWKMEPAVYHSFESYYHKELLLEKVFNSTELLNDQVVWQKIFQDADVSYPYLDYSTLLPKLIECREAIQNSQTMRLIHVSLIRASQGELRQQADLKSMVKTFFKISASPLLRFQYRFFYNSNDILKWVPLLTVIIYNLIKIFRLFD